MTHNSYNRLYDGQLFEGPDRVSFDLGANEGPKNQSSTGNSVDGVYDMSAAADYNPNTSSMNNTTFQYSDSSYDCHNTSELLGLRHIGAGFDYVVSPPDDGLVEAMKEYQNFQAVVIASATRGGPARIVGPDIRYEVFDDSLGTCQPARQHQECVTDPSSGYIATPDPTEGSDIDVNYEHADFHQQHSVHTAYADSPQYPTQMDSDLAGLRLQASAPESASPYGGVLSPLLSGSLTMERSFPLHMYTPDGNPLGGGDTQSVETSSGMYSNDHAGPANSANNGIPFMYGESSLELVGNMMAMSQPGATNTAGVLSNQHALWGEPAFSVRGFPTAMSYGMSTGLGQQELQPSIPSRRSSRRSHRLSVSDEPPSPTTTTTTDFDTTRLTCAEGGCRELFTGYYRQGNLARHVRTVHRKTPYPCRGHGCDRVFQRSDARLKHQRRRHPDLNLPEPVQRR